MNEPQKSFPQMPTKRLIVGVMALMVLTGVLLVLRHRRETSKEISPKVLATSADHLETAKLISHVTDGLVSRFTELAVRFAETQTLRETDPQKLATSFTFTPAVEGVAEWKDERTVAFLPKNPLRSGERYQCIFDVPSVLPALENAKPFAFEFEVALNEVMMWDGDFIPAEKDNPKQMLYKGLLKFADRVNFEDVEKHVLLSAESAPVDVSWKSDSEEKMFWFESSPVLRTEEEKRFAFRLEGKPFSIGKDIEREVVLPPLGDLGVVEVKVLDETDELRLSIQFSDPLAEQPDFGGYVVLDPFIEAKLTASGQTLLVSADFERGTTYRLTVKAGVTSRWETRLKEDYVRDVLFEDIKPQIAFSYTGAFLPSENRRVIAFRTVNLRRVKASIMEVFESNLGLFLQENDLESTKTRRDFDGYLNRFGVQIAEEHLDLGEERNRWLQNEIDLSKLFKGRERGLFLLTLSFERDDMLYNCEGISPDWDNYETYYSNPCKRGYFYSQSKVVKPVIVSDVGLIVKKANDGLVAAATHIGNARPIPDVELTLYSYQNQPIEKQRTNSDGLATFSQTDGFYMEGHWKNQRTALKFHESEVNVSSFDVGGTEGTAKDTRAFVYSDRGVHRPGDPVYLSVVVRNQEDTFPSKHPLLMKVRNPKNQVVLEEVNQEGIEGHYGFTFRSSQTDMTGNWTAEVYNGETLLASHRIRIETVVPNRLKVELETPKTELGPKDKKQEVNIRSSYLFGAPASNLKAQAKVRYTDTTKQFPIYKDYVFQHPALKLKEEEEKLFEGALDTGGAANFEWDLPDFSKAPSSVTATLTARVFEQGGRATAETLVIPVDPYEVYVGVKRTAERYVQLHEEAPFEIVAIDRKGSPVQGRHLEINIYRNQRYWWWQYDSREDFQLRFKTDVNTELVKNVSLKSEKDPILFTYAPDQRGQHLVEVKDGDTGHATGSFLWASSWGSEAPMLTAGSHLEMESDRTLYHPGDTARIAATTPSKGIAFVSVEKGPRVLSTRWISLRDTKTEFEIPITAEMLPNAYVYVTALQPHAQTANDRPLRLYGVLPLHVEEKRTRLHLELSVAPELKPRMPFEVKVATTDGRPATVTVAVVDEGLLDLTDFMTPDPWAFFFHKEKLSVTTFDLFDDVIGVIWGDIHKRFVVGGDEDIYRKRRLGATKAQRFEPVALFEGPVKTDRRGKASFSFEMPNYMGSVRVMAVAASKDSYGDTEKAVPVREPLMLLPTLPRVVGSGESFVLPVTVFALKDGIGRTEIKVETSSPLHVQGQAVHVVDFATKGDTEVRFRMTTDKAVGAAKVRISASSSESSTWTETELAVRSANPLMTEVEEVNVPPNESVEFQIPALGLEGTRSARVKISPVPGLKFNHRIRYLLRYPYGCIEQTTSAAFPQLYLKDFVDILEKPAHAQHETKYMVDRNINATIARMRRFTMADGSFSFWPGGSERSDWATNYAGHFLIEAKRHGYYVPESMLSNWLSFQKKMASKEASDYKTRAYRLYLLSLAGEPQIGPMNLMKEDRLDVLDTVSRWYLAGAYQLAGMEEAAHEVLKSAGTDIPEYRERGGTFGSRLRDQAILLELATRMGESETALSLFQELNTALGEKSYLSTQEIGYGLLAIGKYIDVTWDRTAAVKGRVELPDGAEPLEFDAKGKTVAFDLSQHIGRTVNVHSESSKNLYAVFGWEGVPLEGPQEPESRNLKLEVEWLNENGDAVEPDTLKQGAIFWCRIRLSKQHRGKLENVALTQIFPSGWEIDNTRLTGEAIPTWAKDFRLGRETYMDVRDDRVMWFFDLTGDADVLVKLLAVTQGQFSLAPTYAEAMYDQDYRAVQPGRLVEVTE